MLFGALCVIVPADHQRSLWARFSFDRNFPYTLSIEREASIRSNSSRFCSQRSTIVTPIRALRWEPLAASVHGQSPCSKQSLPSFIHSSAAGGGRNRIQAMKISQSKRTISSSEDRKLAMKIDRRKVVAPILLKRHQSLLKTHLKVKHFGQNTAGSLPWSFDNSFVRRMTVPPFPDPDRAYYRIFQPKVGSPAIVYSKYCPRDQCTKVCPG